MGRTLAGLSYVRFGDVFSKYCPSQSEEMFRFVHNHMLIVLEALYIKKRRKKINDTSFNIEGNEDYHDNKNYITMIHDYFSITIMYNVEG